MDETPEIPPSGVPVSSSLDSQDSPVPLSQVVRRGRRTPYVEYNLSGGRPSASSTAQVFSQRMDTAGSHLDDGQIVIIGWPYEVNEVHYSRFERSVVRELANLAEDLMSTHGIFFPEAGGSRNCSPQLELAMDELRSSSTFEEFAYILKHNVTPAMHACLQSMSEVKDACTGLPVSLTNKPYFLLLRIKNVGFDRLNPPTLERMTYHSADELLERQ